MSKPTGGKSTGSRPAMDGAIMKAPAVAPKPAATKPNTMKVQGGAVLSAPAVPPKK
jgi:hypothetical protein